MRIPAPIVIISIGILSAACAQKSIAPTSFSPSYKTKLEASDATVVRGCSAISSVSVENGLPSAVVGKRTLEDTQFPPQNISIEGDTVGWVRAGADEMFKRAMVKRSPDAPIVKLKLSDLQINENVHVNAGYDARLTLDAAVVNARGAECWTGRKAGASQEYGDHGSAENYRALVDHALDRAVMAVAADSAFQEALCSAACREAAPAKSSGKDDCIAPIRNGKDCHNELKDGGTKKRSGKRRK